MECCGVGVGDGGGGSHQSSRAAQDWIDDDQLGLLGPTSPGPACGVGRVELDLKL